MRNPVQQLNEQGQAVWLDSIDRGMILSGELSRLVEGGLITGLTSNPTIFKKAISGSDAYLAQLAALKQRCLTPYEAFLELASEDLRMAAGILRRVYDVTDGRDGFVSYEVRAGATDAMVAEAQLMFAMIGLPNVMIKIPGTSEGIEAVTRLITAGVNVNVTLLFDTEVYERFADAYLRGLEARQMAGGRIDALASVASFFVSRLDTKVEQTLVAASQLRGKVAIANARLAYQRFQRVFSGERWQALASAGARVQRPLWASTGTKNASYSDVLYVEELVAPETVNTMPVATLRAFLDHGAVRPFTSDDIAAAGAVVDEANRAGVDLSVIASQLLEEGLATFERDFAALLQVIEAALAEG
jgi:transaldolase